MARRRSELSGASMDSLMDTLTNVVGILVIILILVQLNVSMAMKKIISELPPVSIEELQQLKQDAVRQLTDYDQLKKDIEKVRDEAKKESTALAKLTPELDVLETTAKKTAVPLLDLGSLQKQIEEKTKIVEAEKKAAEKLLAEQQRLKALLDTTPVVAPPVDKVVRIPNSRPVPENARLERYLITAGQLFYIDMEGAKKVMLQDFQSNRGRLEHSRIKAPDGSNKTIYDQEKVVKHFEQRRLSYRNFDLRVTAGKTSTRVSLQLVPRIGQGEPIETAAQMTSRFQTDLRRFKTGNTVVWFHVARDAFEVYLRARDICDTQGLPAGWEAMNTPVYAEGITEFEVNRLEEPKPADPNAINIAPPKKKLD